MKNLITGFLNQVMLAEASTGKRKTFRWNMIRRDLVLTIPNPHRSEISVDLLIRILRQAGSSREEWNTIADQAPSGIDHRCRLLQAPQSAQALVLGYRPAQPPDSTRRLPALSPSACIGRREYDAGIAGRNLNKMDSFSKREVKNLSPHRSAGTPSAQSSTAARMASSW